MTICIYTYIYIYMYVRIYYILYSIIIYIYMYTIRYGVFTRICICIYCISIMATKRPVGKKCAQVRRGLIILESLLPNIKCLSENPGLVLEYIGMYHLAI